MSDTGLWVFGYASLMWNPGFRYDERMQARLPGYARTFCMWSVHHRGTHDAPGLVLALDRTEGTHCDGLGFRIAAGHEEATIAYLRERELISSAYLEERHDIALTDGRQVEALTYVVDPHHVQYCGTLPLDEQAQVIARAVGGRGPNTEYLYNTVEHLDELGIADADLSWLVDRVRGLTAPAD